MTNDSANAGTSSATEPKYHTHYGLMYRIVAEYPDSEDGTREANQFMEGNPGVGVLAVEGGRIILAHEDDHGAATDVDLVINRMKAAAKADRWGRSSASVGLKLIIVDVSRSGSFAWQIGGQRVKLAQVRALFEEASAKGELPGAMPRND